MTEPRTKNPREKSARSVGVWELMCNKKKERNEKERFCQDLILWREE